MCECTVKSKVEEQSAKSMVHFFEPGGTKKIELSSNNQMPNSTKDKRDKR